MIRALLTPFSTERYKTVADKARARLMLTLAIALLGVYSVFILAARSNALTFSDVPGVAQRLNDLIPVALITMYSAALVMIILLRLGFQTGGSYMMILSFYAGTMLISVPNGMVYAPMGTPLVLLILLGGFLLGTSGLVVTIAASTVAVVLALAQRQNLEGVPDNGVFTFILFVTLFIITGILLRSFLRVQEISQEEQVGKASRGREELAALTTQLAQRISRHFVLDELLESTVEDIRKTYPDIYHVQIFLNDNDANEARLAASTGEVGKALLRRKHSLPIGSRSVIGQVTALGKPVIASATGETVHKKNELLPDTAAEAAFPLRLGTILIGALDLQSKQGDAFDNPDDQTIFQSLADSIAIAVDNARLFEQTEQRVAENQRLLDQMRGTMFEVERLNRELTGRAWSNFMAYKGDSALGVTVDLESSVVRQSAELTSSLEATLREGRVLQSQSRDQNIISAPLRVRGQVIGAMEFEVGDAALTDEDIALVSGVAERFSLALESARLYEESRRVAQRETTLNEIGSRLQTTNTVDALLAETARGLQASLGANRVAIRLGAPPKINGSNGGEGR